MISYSNPLPISYTPCVQCSHLLASSDPCAFCTFRLARAKRLFQSLLLAHLLAVLLEAVADALLGGHPLEDAPVDAAVLLGGDGLGGEVVDARGEAVLDEAAECLYAGAC